MANNLVDVPEAWVAGEAYESGRFGTDGDVIWSYKVVLGYTNDEGKKVYIRNSKGYGSYARGHIRATREAAHLVRSCGEGTHTRWSCAASNCSHMPEGVFNPKLDKAKVSRYVQNHAKMSKKYAEEVLRELEAVTG